MPLSEGQSQHLIGFFWLQGCCAVGWDWRQRSWSGAGQSGFRRGVTSLFLSMRIWDELGAWVTLMLLWVVPRIPIKMLALEKPPG